jgi:hypothetical protein
MAHRSGESRQQAALFPVMLDELVAPDALVRVIDAWIGALALADLVAGSARALDFPDGPEVVLLGGCACSGDPYQPLIEAAIRSACPAARITPPAFSPVHGAALNALHAGGIHPLPELTFHHQQS